LRAGVVAASFAVSALLSRYLVRVMRRRGGLQTVSEDVPDRHLAKAGTPTMGGLAIVASVLLVWAVWLAAGARGFGRGFVLVNLLLMGLFAGFSGIGFLDDLLSVRRSESLGLRAREKLTLQFVVAGAFVWSGVAYSGFTTQSWLPGRDAPISLGWWYYPAGALLIVLLSNAANLTDGLDGLAGGLFVVAGMALAVSLSGTGFDLGLLAFAGACLGFLTQNVYPARIFMGDTGSIPGGALLAGFALVTHSEWLLLFCCSLLWIELLSVVLQVASYRLAGKRVFKMSPLHHHFELSGWREPEIVARFWAFGAFVAAIGVVLAYAWD
jgi:phospho-N-acetylmuramoyl-pentapeptide-transferase